MANTILDRRVALPPTSVRSSRYGLYEKYTNRALTSATYFKENMPSEWADYAQNGMQVFKVGADGKAIMENGRPVLTRIKCIVKRAPHSAY